MIGFLHGIVRRIQEDCCLLDVNGVGYRIYLSETTKLQLEENQSVTIYTYLNVREDALQLFGFLTQAEYDLFILLISVSGIGPKVGMGILSGMSPQAIRMAIAAGDVPTLVKLPGIGKKSAERLILELKDKIGDIVIDDRIIKKVDNINASIPNSVKDETLVALCGLGYVESEVLPIIEALEDEYKDVSSLLRATLSEIGKRR